MAATLEILLFCTSVAFWKMMILFGLLEGHIYERSTDGSL